MSKKEIDVVHLANAHWSYVASVLRCHKEASEVINKCKHHYISAFIHGFKHAEEEYRKK